jgi:hypothetical protein
MKSQPSRREFLLQPKPERGPKIAGQSDALCSREAAGKGKAH